MLPFSLHAFSCGQGTWLGFSMALRERGTLDAFGVWAPHPFIQFPQMLAYLCPTLQGCKIASTPFNEQSPSRVNLGVYSWIQIPCWPLQIHGC